MRAILSSEKFLNTDMDLPIGLGKTISNEVYVADLAKMPHAWRLGAALVFAFLDFSEDSIKAGVGKPDMREKWICETCLA